MKMKEDKNIIQYAIRIKALVSAIRAFGGKIEDVTVVSKVLRTLLLVYAVRESTIQEMRCDPTIDINLDSLVGRLTTFELDNFDKFVPNSSHIESDYKEKLTLNKKNRKKAKQVESEEDSTNEDIEIFEALLAK